MKKKMIRKKAPFFIRTILLDIFATSCYQLTNQRNQPTKPTNELKNIGRRFSIGRPKKTSYKKSDFFCKNNLVGHFCNFVSQTN